MFEGLEDEIPWSNSVADTEGKVGGKSWAIFENSCNAMKDRVCYSPDASRINLCSRIFVFIYEPELMPGGSLYKKHLGEDEENLYFGRSVLKHADHFDHDNEEIAPYLNSSGYKFAKRSNSVKNSWMTGLAPDATLTNQQSSKYVEGDLWAVTPETLFKLDALYENHEGDFIRRQSTKTGYPTLVKCLEGEGKSIRSVWVYMLKSKYDARMITTGVNDWNWHVGMRSPDNTELKKTLGTTFNVEIFRKGS